MYIYGIIVTDSRALARRPMTVWRKEREMRLTEERREQKIRSLKEQGFKCLDKLHKIQTKLEDLNAIDKKDPYGWRT